jgi:hypothetical protein
MQSLLVMLQKDGVQPRRVTAMEYSSACPACGGRDRFRIWPEQGRFWCRGCGIQGDGIQYLRDVRGLDYREACALLGIEPRDRDRSASPSPVGDRKPAWTPKDAQVPPPVWREKAAKLIEWAERYLWSPAGAEALEWLRGERFLSDKTIRGARLGWLPQDFYRDRAEWGLPEALSDKGRPKKVWLPSGLVIPLIRDGEVHRVRIRRPEPGDGPRYVLLSGSSSAPMVLGEGREVFVVVESEMDVLLVHQECSDLVGCIAMGSASNRPDARTTELLRGAQSILVALDGDSAGAREAWRWWPENFSRVKRLPPVSGKDPTEMRAAGLDLRAWIGARLSQPRQVDAPPAGNGDNSEHNLDYLTDTDPEELELFASALKGIETGSQLGRLYPQIRGYLRRELTPEHFRILELAYREALVARRGVSC